MKYLSPFQKPNNKIIQSPKQYKRKNGKVAVEDQIKEQIPQ